MLEGGPLLDDEFAALAKDCVLFCHITTRIEGHPNDDLLTKMGGNAFPTFMVLDADGNKLADGGDWSSWPPPPADFKKLVNKGRELQQKLKDLTAAVAKGDAKAEPELLQLQIDLRQIGLDQAKKRLGALHDLDAAASERLQVSLVGLEFDAILASDKIESQEDAVRVGKRLAAMPVGPTGDKAEMFWGLIMQYAESEKDVAAFERGIAGMQALYGEHPNFAGWIERVN